LLGHRLGEAPVDAAAQCCRVDHRLQDQRLAAGGQPVQPLPGGGGELAGLGRHQAHDVLDASGGGEGVAVGAQRRRDERRTPAGGVGGVVPVHRGCRRAGPAFDAAVSGLVREVDEFL
jgi:hypothetical protein